MKKQLEMAVNQS